MAKHLKLFDLTAEYQAYVNGPNMILPNVSVCKDNNTKVYYNPSNGGESEEPSVDVLQGAKILCKYNVSDTSNPVILYHQQSGSGSGSGSGEGVPMFSLMEVDGVEQAVTNLHTFNTIGEHTVLFTLSEGVTSIGTSAFKDCFELTSVTIGNSVTSIGLQAFDGCSALTSVTIPDSVTSIGASAFYSCSGLTSITIPNSVTSIGAYALYGCSGLTNITIPNSVTSIDYGTFDNCSGLTSIIIGNLVTLIDDYALRNCSALTSIICNATTAPTIQNSTFVSVKTSGTLTVPAGSTGYDVWMGTGDYYLGKYNWTKVEV